MSYQTHQQQKLKEEARARKKDFIRRESMKQQEYSTLDIPYSEGDFSTDSEPSE